MKPSINNPSLPPRPGMPEIPKPRPMPEPPPYPPCSPRPYPFPIHPGRASGHDAPFLQ